MDRMTPDDIQPQQIRPELALIFALMEQGVSPMDLQGLFGHQAVQPQNLTATRPASSESAPTAIPLPMPTPEFLRGWAGRGR